jgi:hypothetical protein
VSEWFVPQRQEIPMTTAPAGGLLAFLEQVPDPRGRKGRRHPLAAMLATLVSAVLCGCRGNAAIAQWIHLQRVSTWHAFGYLRKPPTENAFRNLLLAIDPDALEAVLWRWITEGLGLELSEDVPQAVVIDGKTLRGTVARHRRTVHVLALLDLATGGVLGQTPVHEDTNEAKTALQFLQNLVLEGKVVVGDAAFCQRDVCRQVLDSGGDYLVIVKGNQPALKREIENAFAGSEAFSPLRPA